MVSEASRGGRYKGFYMSHYSGRYSGRYYIGALIVVVTLWQL